MLKAVWLGLAAGLLIVLAVRQRRLARVDWTSLPGKYGPARGVRAFPGLESQLVGEERRRRKRNLEQMLQRVRDRFETSAREGFAVRHLEPKFKTVDELRSLGEYEMALEYLNLIEVQIPRKETPFVGHEEK